MYVDLHIHSTFSDSSRTPEEIAAVAKARGVSLAAICDHNTIAGWGRFQRACRDAGIRCVLSIEMGADLDGQDLHMLAYNFDPDNAEMLAFIQQQDQVNQGECEDMIARMSRDYPAVSVADYRAFSPPPDIGGWKYLHYAVARGAFASYEDANRCIFPTYYKPRLETWPLEEFCALVRRAGGVPVFAHPGDAHCADSCAFRAMLDAVLARGIGGVECYYPSHSAEVTGICLDFCRQNGLCITAGSDCHGSYDPAPGFTIGALAVEEGQLMLEGII